MLIDFDAKTDRELLVLTAQKANESAERLKILNGTVAQNCIKLNVLETQMHERTIPHWMHSTGKLAGIGALMVAVTTALVTLLTKLIENGA